MSDPAAPRPAGPNASTRGLAGDLPCIRCGYNLRGLSVVGVCPECATPVRATILAAVDPYANLLMPIPYRRITALGLVVWSAAALGAALATWGIRARDLVEMLGGIDVAFDWLVPAGLVLTVLSGVGALVIIRPHARIPRWQIGAAAAGCAAYIPLAWAYWRIHALIDGAPPGPYLEGVVDTERSELRLLAGAMMLVILLGLRPNARLLAARSLLLREGRVDRQTMLAMSAVVLIGALGDLLRLLAVPLSGDFGFYAATAGTVLIAVSFMLLTGGLAGMVIDVSRIWPVVVEPSPSVSQLLGHDRPRQRREPDTGPFPPAGAGDAARA